jgi:hypothetical protein
MICHSLVRTRSRVSQFTCVAIKQASNDTSTKAFGGPLIQMPFEWGCAWDILRVPLILIQSGFDEEPYPSKP